MQNVNSNNDIKISGHQEGEGNTPAGWYCVLIMLSGFLISGISMTLNKPVGFFVGLGVVILGLFTGLVLKKMGYGIDGNKLKTKMHN